MKTMIMRKVKFIHRCLKLRQSVCVMMSLITMSANAGELAKENESLIRKPSAIEEEVLTVPLTNDDNLFTNEKMFAEDDAGVMRDLKATMKSWEDTEEYAKVWGIESTGRYNTPTTSEKSKYITKKMMRYADKRLSGEMKRADEGSALHTVKIVEKNLRPNASVNVTKNFGFKFKARVLQGKAVMEVKNPWIECNATVAVNGRMRVITRKEFKQLGLASGAEYSLDEGQFLTYIDQQVTENVKARVSNISGNNADSKVEMMASFPFNL